MAYTTNRDHPYKSFEGSAVWCALDKAIADLEKNQDLNVTTAREYVLGYLCNELSLLRTIPKDSIPFPKSR